jgi:hypothetical protein
MNKFWLANRTWLGAALLAAFPAGLGATTILLNPISNASGHIGDFVPGAPVQGTPAQQANADAYAAMRRAADRWESILLDNIVINIWVDFASLGSNVLGSAGPNGVTYNYADQFLPVIANHLVTSPDPFLANLPVGNEPFPVILPAGFTFTGNISVSFANAKALGFTDSFLTNCNPTPGAMGSGNFCDGVMQFSRDFPLDLDRSDGLTGYDLEGIAMHEIGHILGFFSEVDTIDCMLDPQNRCGLTTNGLPGGPVRPPGPGPTDISVLDLYRFADCQKQPNCVQQEPVTAAAFSTAQRLLSTADPAVFVAGDSRFEFSRGLYTGDGYQASHWGKPFGPPVGLMDPDAAPGEALAFTGADYRAMQALGYNVASVPEPASIVLMSSGCLLVIFARRRRG